MNSIKTILAVSLAALSMNTFTVPVMIECADKTIEYDHRELTILDTQDMLQGIFPDSSLWNGSGSNKVRKVKFPLIDSKAFALILELARKDDLAAFIFIDSLDEQTFKLLCFYTQVIKESRIADLIKFKILKNPEFKKHFDFSAEKFQLFVYNKCKACCFRFGLDRSLYGNNNPALDSIEALLSLVYFYNNQLKKPLPIDADHLKQVFNEQTDDIKQILLSKNLVTI